MTFRDIDINVSKETKSMLKEVEKFSMEVMRPAGIELDRLNDPEDVFKKDSVLWDVFKGFREMDLHLLQIPNRLGGMADDLDPMAGILMTEQLGYADAGLTITMGVSSMPFNAAAQFPMPEMQQLARDFCADKSGEMVGCWAITEPDHGSDTIMPHHPLFSDPNIKAQCRARLDAATDPDGEGDRPGAGDALDFFEEVLKTFRTAFRILDTLGLMS